MILWLPETSSCNLSNCSIYGFVTQYRNQTRTVQGRLGDSRSVEGTNMRYVHYLCTYIYSQGIWQKTNKQLSGKGNRLIEVVASGMPSESIGRYEPPRHHRSMMYGSRKSMREKCTEKVARSSWFQFFPLVYHGALFQIAKFLNVTQT